MSDWKEYRLSDFAEIIKDGYNPNGNECLSYIGLEHIEQEKLRLSGVGKSTDVSSNKFKFKTNDILFGKLRPYFRKVVRPQFYGICSTDIWVFRAKKVVIQNYLYYFLANWEFVNTANKADSGTRMPRADWNFLKETKWLIASSITEQNTIASILINLDNKIDLLHRQNKTLEELTHNLFKKMDLENKNTKSQKLNEIIDFEPRERINSKEACLFFEMKCLSNDSMLISEGEYRVVSSATTFRNNDTLLAKITPCLENGKTGFVMQLNENQIAKGSTEFIVMRAKENISPYWVYCLACSSEFRDTAILSMTGTSGRQRVQVEMLKDYDVSVNYENMKLFHRTVKPFFTKIKVNQKQIINLQRLRDTLLPKLMNGEIRVNEL